MKDGAFVTLPLEIVIAKTKKGDAIQCEYAYGQKGQKDYYQSTRYLKLNPSKSLFTLWWQGDNKDVYKATGLEEFSKNGLGSFSGIAAFGSAQNISRITFRLESDSLSYQWEHGIDGHPLEVSALFLLKRVP